MSASSIPSWLQKLVEATNFDKVQFLSPKITAEFLKKDSDGYVRSMTKMDLIARKSISHQDYINKIADAAKNTIHNPNDMAIVSKSSFVVDSFFRKHVKDIDGALAAKIPWKVAIIAGKTYEDGLPHTREDIIFLTPETIRQPDIVRTLIHEKVHLYQRLYPYRMQVWLNENKLRAAGATHERSINSNIRSNPDIGDKYYTNYKPATYTTSSPRSITDVYNGGAEEHPYEEMAYAIADTYAR
jgi:hypothetical protein